MEIIEYRPEGVCSVLIQIAIEDNIIKDMAFTGGCNGNLQAVRALCIGRSADEIAAKLQGINCGGKGTSCPDQLAKCLVEYLKKQVVKS